MPSANVRMPWPLTRVPTIMPGQFGVPGTGHETGLRLSCTGTIFYVDPNYPGVSDLRDGTEPTDPLATVGAALTHCQDYRGDVIVVMANDAWTLSENVDQVLPIRESVTVSVHGVKIVGMSPSGALGVTWKPTAAFATAITVEAMDVLIEGFCFAGDFNPAILTRWDSPDYYGDNVTIRHNYFGIEVPDWPPPPTNLIVTGIETRWMYHSDIHHNIFDQCEEYGIYANPNFGAPRYCMIHDNWFINAGTTAIYMENSAHCKIAYNQIENDDAILGAAGPGATDSMIMTTGTGWGNIIHHNVMTCLLPVVPGGAAGDYDDCNSPSTPGGPNVEAWIQNYCMDGSSVTNPA